MHYLQNTVALFAVGLQRTQYALMLLRLVVLFWQVWAHHQQRDRHVTMSLPKEQDHLYKSRRADLPVNFDLTPNLGSCALKIREFRA